jgi:hypothetical protein
MVLSSILGCVVVGGLGLQPAGTPGDVQSTAKADEVYIVVVRMAAALAIVSNFLSVLVFMIVLQ